MKVYAILTAATFFASCADSPNAPKKIETEMEITSPQQIHSHSRSFMDICHCVSTIFKSESNLHWKSRIKCLNC